MSADLIKLYKQLDNMNQTPEVEQIRNQIQETLYQDLRSHLLQLTAIGRVIGYDELQKELEMATHLIGLQKDVIR